LQDWGALVVEKAGFSLKQRNPDVLTSIANLSNDEVFTPPSFANQMLDTIEEAWAKNNDGANIWKDSSVTFLDPFTKSGVFLREITSRLSKGLAKQIPDDQERLNHILTKQVFGVAITELTALLARRSVYCSKHANGEHSICTEFDTPEGNIWFERTEHTWLGGKEKIITVDDHGNDIEITTDGTCKFCGAKQKEYDRGIESESHAYALIHTDDPKSWVATTFGENMQFDVIVGNPPYQLNDGGGLGGSAMPIYQRFVEQSKALKPRYLSMVIPARWLSGGRGLDDFRKEALTDRRFRLIADFVEASSVFPGVQVKGGVLYFLWDRDNEGTAKVITHGLGETPSESVRPLLEPGLDYFIRFTEAVGIVRKVAAIENGAFPKDVAVPDNRRFSKIVSARKPFGLPSNFRGNPKRESANDLVLFENGGTAFVPKQLLPSGDELAGQWKLFLSFAYGAGEGFPHQIIGKPILGEPDSACTETYLAIGPFDSKTETVNAACYMSTKFFRFLVMLRKPSQNGTRGVYEGAPLQDFSKRWTDEELYAKYKLTEEEIEFIESMIRPMELEYA
jgi:hypothetical protein